MVRTQVQLDSEQYESLKDLARLQGVSMAEIIRRGAAMYLKASSPSSVSRDELRRRAMKMAGRFKMGRTDIAENHDKYLAEAYSQ
jgi:hypothetical protein